jgi:hypothetical protein
MGQAAPGEPAAAAAAVAAAVAVAAAQEAVAGCRLETSIACSLAEGISGAWVIPVALGSSGKTSTVHRLALGSGGPLRMCRTKTG